MGRLLVLKFDNLCCLIVILGATEHLMNERESEEVEEPARHRKTVEQSRSNLNVPLKRHRLKQLLGGQRSVNLQICRHELGFQPIIE